IPEMGQFYARGIGLYQRPGGQLRAGAFFDTSRTVRDVTPATGQTAAVPLSFCEIPSSVVHAGCDESLIGLYNGNPCDGGVSATELWLSRWDNTMALTHAVLVGTGLDYVAIAAGDPSVWLTYTV